jgi:hypothetical protein
MRNTAPQTLQLNPIQHEHAVAAQQLRATPIVARL